MNRYLIVYRLFDEICEHCTINEYPSSREAIKCSYLTNRQVLYTFKIKPK